MRPQIKVEAKKAFLVHILTCDVKSRCMIEPLVDLNSYKKVSFLEWLLHAHRSVGRPGPCY